MISEQQAYELLLEWKRALIQVIDDERDLEEEEEGSPTHRLNRSYKVKLEEKIEKMRDEMFIESGFNTETVF